jgi:hypothetical protein
MLEQLKRVNVDGADIDEMVALIAFADSMIGVYRAKMVDVPEWLEAKRTGLDRELTIRHEAELERKLKLLDADIEGMATREERLSAKKAERERLMAALGRKTEPAAAA